MRTTIYSSVLLGDGAVGEQRLFTVPQGQPLPRLGKNNTCTQCGVSESIAQTAEHTNLTRAGEMGSAIGDVVLRSFRAYVDDGSKPNARLEAFISGRKAFTCFLREALEAPIEFKSVTPDEYMLARTDAFELRIFVDQPLKLEKPVIVRCEFAADAVMDVRN